MKHPSKRSSMILMYLATCVVCGGFISSRGGFIFPMVPDCRVPVCLEYTIDQIEGQWAYEHVRHATKFAPGRIIFSASIIRNTRYGIVFPTHRHEVRQLTVDWPSNGNSSMVGGLYAGQTAAPWRESFAAALTVNGSQNRLSKQVLDGDVDRLYISWLGVSGNALVFAILGLPIMAIIVFMARTIRRYHTYRINYHNSQLYAGYCPHCRYDLRGVDSDVCSECGASRALITT